MKISINQPAYLPWLGYFERIASSDVHVVLDHVQYEKNSFTNRNKVRSKEATSWLTIPISTKGKFGNLEIKELKFAGSSTWKTKHLKSLKLNYSKSKYFQEYHKGYERIYAKDWEGFMPFVDAMLMQHLKDLNIKTKIVYSSEINAMGEKSELILDICKKLNAKYYLSGKMGRNYLDENLLSREGIRTQYQDYQHPTYNQAWEGFYSHLGIVDLLFNEGPRSLEIIKSNS